MFRNASSRYQRGTHYSSYSSETRFFFFPDTFAECHTILKGEQLVKTHIEELEKRLELEPENVEVMVELASLYGEEDEIHYCAPGHDARVARARKVDLRSIHAFDESEALASRARVWRIRTVCILIPCPSTIG